jgi:hypothetical protein
MDAARTLYEVRIVCRQFVGNVLIFKISMLVGNSCSSAQLRAESFECTCIQYGFAACRPLSRASRAYSFAFISDSQHEKRTRVSANRSYGF